MPATVEAQARRSMRGPGLAFDAGAMYGNLMGGDFSASNPAAGFDAHAGVLIGRWQLGAGYDRTNHGRDDTDGDYVVSNVYGEARVFFGGGGFRPYGAGRLGRAMASYQGVLGITEKATGYIAGVGAGVAASLRGPFGVDVAADYDRLSHDYGTGGYSEAEKGGRLSVRAGLRLQLLR